MTTIASVVVGGKVSRSPNAQDSRMTFAAQIAAYCRGRGAKIVLLPAGYLFSADAEETPRTSAKALAKVFSGLCLIAGIDSADAEKLESSKAQNGKRLDKWTRNESLPFWVFASDSSGKVLTLFRQRSTTSSNGKAAGQPSPAEQQHRTVKLAGLQCYLLACGELFNPFLRPLLEQEQGFALIAHLGHKGLGRTFPKSFPALANATGAWVINAQHTWSGECWAAEPGKKARRIPGDVIHETTHSSGEWARVAFWDVP
ncbi:hypothetical protein COCOR_06309 [Corallococcus coralloides DSM 2259]|uniref:CN hydrolase domain-containing protein n=1 Tax=Corallococcus coralloides (strain ATCC 25202 / DSM 2259 / NBRC 100086 / M2) TaxID=1144275 RepID=H8MQ76_CORCM|nr:hypothetical protein [Corallococcus coralloides]AFE06857.1 hypothetical protein COCOR_06309 [Corallococcus coralloides DSM 2259]